MKLRLGLQAPADLTAVLAKHDKDENNIKALNFALLEDFDHLYRYANLLKTDKNEDADMLVGKFTEILPGLPTLAENRYPAELLEHAKAESFGTEFLDYKMAVKTVKSFEDALGHIQENSSKHSECIVTENKERAALFTKIVDAACVYTNVSTAFTDGAQFGLGAEIGISTQKLHARGPMGLEEITSYKWVIEGDGQTRRN